MAGAATDLRDRLEQQHANFVAEIEHALLQGRAEIQACSTRSFAQHQAIQLQEKQLRNVAESLEAERYGAPQQMQATHLELLDYFNRYGSEAAAAAKLFET